MRIESHRGLFVTHRETETAGVNQSHVNGLRGIAGTAAFPSWASLFADARAQLPDLVWRRIGIPAFLSFVPAFAAAELAVAGKRLFAPLTDS